MKTIQKIITAIGMIVLIQANVDAQVTVPTNNGLGGEYVGWDNTMTVPLDIKTEQPQPINFYTNAGAGTFNNIKMSIMRRTINGTERAGVGIHERGNNPITFPRSILHLGENYFTSGVAGWRTWMDIGTFSGLESDFAFFGIVPFDGDTTDGQHDHNDAALVWGDNIQGVDGADNLRILFSAPMVQTAGNWATQFTSLEVARFIPAGRMGIGNFTGNAIGGGSGIPPMRRLDIYDEHLNSTLTAAPQLRLTYTPNAAINNGIWSDFQTTSNGDLFIHPYNTANDRSVGINTNAPAAVLNVSANNIAASGNNPGELFRTDAPTGYDLPLVLV